jgi:hypothetical protein
MQKQDLSARHFTCSAVHIVEQFWSRWADRSMPDQMTDQAVGMLALWSLLRWERKVGLVALERMGVVVDALACDVDRALSALSAEIWRQAGPPKLEVLPSGQRGVVMDFDALLEPLLAAAEHEALGLGHAYVGSEHLLLAAVRAAGPRLQEVLDRHRVGYDGIRQAVLEVLRS